MKCIVYGKCIVHTWYILDTYLVHTWYMLDIVYLVGQTEIIN